MSEPLLRLEGLKTHFFTDDGVVRAVDGVSYHLGERETLAFTYSILVKDAGDLEALTKNP